MPKGGWRGGVKPRAWLLRDGEPAIISQIKIPKQLLSAVREVAHMFDRGELTIEHIRILREMLKTRSIEEIKTEAEEAQ